jgi:hypothetical protein
MRQIATAFLTLLALASRSGSETKVFMSLQLCANSGFLHRSKLDAGQPVK